ncbi:MAG: hypothetical protein BMS9Abin05_0665 [Rhodothermia bacterium]|nr:MAG: hypothetical protein BMS9Abin05_0665 [Rhodothermia bacterium]
MYGAERYLKSAVASALTIRRHDNHRPIALFADDASVDRLRMLGLDSLFSPLEILPEGHRSIVGFKHHLYRFHPFDRCLFVDADMIWCRNPDPLWKQLSAFEFTGTGVSSADFFFGAHKKAGVIIQFLTNQRRKTIRRFGVTYLPRVQAGMLYSGNLAECRRVCSEAEILLSRKAETHFRSRLNEGRNEESCEWSLALAFARLRIPVFPWYQGRNTPQMDYISDFVEHDDDFNVVSCLYFNHSFANRLRELQTPRLRDVLLRLYSSIPGKSDHMTITPFVLHFGWLKYKGVFNELADRLWEKAVADCHLEADVPKAIPSESNSLE